MSEQSGRAFCAPRRPAFCNEAEQKLRLPLAIRQNPIHKRRTLARIKFWIHDLFQIGATKVFGDLFTLEQIVDDRLAVGESLHAYLIDDLVSTHPTELFA